VDPLDLPATLHPVQAQIVQGYILSTGVDALHVLS
jgi:hypothetical protein